MLLGRFMQYVEPVPEAGCWLWVGGWSETGYGRFNFNGTPTSAHRASWRLHCGEIPHGLCVLHRCDTRCCVNPGHLFLGTQTDNIVDMQTKGRHAHGAGFARAVTASRARGERSGRAKLSNDQVRSIRAHGGTLDEIAAEFGIHRNYVSALRMGHYRKDLS